MTYQITTDGLVEPGIAAATLQAVQWAAAAGTANAITAAYSPANVALTDGLILGFRASAANTTSTPTFSPDGLTAHVITARGGSGLLAGDVYGTNAEILVRYNLANTRWEILNPARSSTNSWAVGAGTADAITAAYAQPVLALTDGLFLRVRATAANTTSTPTFAPSGLTAAVITKLGGAALVAGDIAGNLAEILLIYNLANNRWELLNPAVAALAVQSMAMQGELFKALVADDTGGGNVNTAQPWFPTAGSVVVAAGQVYVMRGLLWLSRTAGTTSHTVGCLFGGSATITAITYALDAMIGDANALVALDRILAVAATSTVFKVASTSATEQVVVSINGIVKINAAGTFIPEYIYSVAPGGTPTAKVGSYFGLMPYNNPQGTWA